MAKKSLFIKNHFAIIIVQTLKFVKKKKIKSGEQYGKRTYMDTAYDNACGTNHSNAFKKSVLQPRFKHKLGIQYLKRRFKRGLRAGACRMQRI